jgi:hypothetical protein
LSWRDTHTLRGCGDLGELLDFKFALYFPSWPLPKGGGLFEIGFCRPPEDKFWGSGGLFAYPAISRRVLSAHLRVGIERNHGNPSPRQSDWDLGVMWLASSYPSFPVRGLSSLTADADLCPTCGIVPRSPNGGVYGSQSFVAGGLAWRSLDSERLARLK